VRGLPYPGSNSQKRAARILLYQHAAGRRRVGSAVTLAGQEPEEELYLLRDYLGWRGDQTWFVDRSKESEVVGALERVRAMWPEAWTVNEDLRRALERIPVIGFANLDFMGFLTEETLQCLRGTVERMVRGAILGFTWYRGRENFAYHRSAMRVFAAGADQDSLGDKRWAGTIRVINEETNRRLVLLDALEYRNNVSPMAMLVFEKV
jgi:hypothetical protein